MARNRSIIVVRSEYPKEIVISILPGRNRAGSNFSIWLVVMTKIRPSLDATPSMILRRPEREMPWLEVLL